MNTNINFDMITNARAIRFALALAQKASDEAIHEAVHEAGANDSLLPRQYWVAKLAHMNDQASKPRKRPEKTIARRNNERLAHELVAAMQSAGAKSISNKWITEHVRGVISSAKATQVCIVAISLGLIERQREGRTVTYRLK